MNCADCERLLDAYLDDELAGSLRLEFDAHRIRCPRCQSILAMLEAAGNVVACDRHGPQLSEDFAERVMDRIAGRQARPMTRLLGRIGHPSRRVLVVGGLALQAAAIVVFAVFLHSPRSMLAPAVDPRAAELAAAGFAPDSADRVGLHEAYYDLIVSRMDAAQRNMSTSLRQLAQVPLALNVSDDVARASADVSSVNPWTGFLRAIVPTEADSGEPHSPQKDVYPL